MSKGHAGGAATFELAGQTDLRLLGIPRLREPSLEELGDLYGTTLQDVGGVFGAYAAEIAHDAQQTDFAKDPDGTRRIAFLYEVWNATHQSDQSELQDFAASFSTADAFRAAYAPTATDRSFSAFTFWIDRFNRYIVPHEREVRFIAHSHELPIYYRDGMYHQEGEWFRIDEADGSVTYVDRPVVEEAAGLEAELIKSEADLFHATGSAALPGIARQGAILSARRLTASGERIRTGEFQHTQGQVKVIGDNKQPLENVYASTYLSPDYATSGWFDEYPVVFGFDGRSVEDFLVREKGWREARLVGPNAHGWLAGDELPVSLVRALYTFSPFVARLAEWSRVNTPDALVMSLEAASLLREHSAKTAHTLYTHYPFRYRVPSLRTAAELLKTTPIAIAPA